MQKAINSCPECTGEVLDVDGVSVCKQCGLEITQRFKPDNRVPMKEVRSPTCDLDAFTGSKGARNLRTTELRKVLAVNYPTGAAVPINQIRVLTQRHKAEIIEKMDLIGSQLMKQYVNPLVGTKSNRSIIFAQTLAVAINKVGLPLVHTNDIRLARAFTKSTFFWVWRKMGLPHHRKIRFALWPKKGGTPEMRTVEAILNQTFL